MNTQRGIIYAQRQKVLSGEELRDNMLSMLRQVVDSTVMDILSVSGGVADEETLEQAIEHFEGVFYPKDSLQIEKQNLSAQELADAIYEKAVTIYEKKEQLMTPAVMRELERVVMLRVVDEYWMDNIDAMDDLKQGIGLRAYGQHDPVIAYKEEGYQMFQAMIQAIRDETIRRMFVVQVRPRQEVKREKVAKETGTTAATQSQVKKAPVRKDKKAGPNDPCPCGSGKKYKKCCMQKDKMAE